MEKLYVIHYMENKDGFLDGWEFTRTSDYKKALREYAKAKEMFLDQSNMTVWLEKMVAIKDGKVKDFLAVKNNELKYDYLDIIQDEQENVIHLYSKEIYRSYSKDSERF